MLTTLSRTIAPQAISSSSSGRGKIAMSKAAPSRIARFNAALSRNSTPTATSYARSKAGTSSCNSGRMAPPQKIVRGVVVVITRLTISTCKEKGRPIGGPSLYGVDCYSAAGSAAGSAAPSAFTAASFSRSARIS